MHFHAGTAEVEAEIRRLKGTDPIAPGSREYVRLVLSEPLLILPGDRFIVRMFSPVVTIGGGVVLDIAAPRRGVNPIACEFSKAPRCPNASRCWPANRATESECPSWWRAPACSKPTFERPSAAASLTVLESPQFWLLDPGWVAAKLEALHEHLKLFHRQNPLLAGASKEELRSKFLPGAPPWLMDALLARSKTLTADAETIRLSSHKVALKQDEEEATAKIENAFRSGGLATPAVQRGAGKIGRRSGPRPHAPAVDVAR